MSDIPQISDFTNNLIELADCYAVDDTVKIDHDVNGDGVLDRVSVNYRDREYEFSVGFGKTGTPGIARGFWTEQTHRAPFSFERDNFTKLAADANHFAPAADVEKFYVKGENGTTAQIDWSAIAKEYPDFARFLFSPSMKHVAAGFALLFRSPSFRKIFQKAIDSGYRFAARPDVAGPQIDHRQKLVSFPEGCNFELFLAIFSHELAHMHDSKEDKTSVQSYVESYVMNEVRADQFAFQVLDELGLKVDDSWSISSKRYDAHVRGERELAAEIKRSLGAQGLTYLEEAYLNYTIPQDEGAKYAALSAELTRPRVELLKPMHRWNNYIVQAAKDKGITPERIMDSDEARSIASQHPLLAKTLRDDRREWLEAISLLIGPFKDHKDAVEKEERANSIANRLFEKYQEDGLEEIRVANSSRLGIEKLYDDSPPASSGIQLAMIVADACVLGYCSSIIDLMLGERNP